MSALRYQRSCHQPSRGRRPAREGITLLLVILVLSALLSISIGIFNVVFGEIRISGEMADSFVALYAADQGVEKVLYDDRIENVICPALPAACTYGPATFGPSDPLLPTGACFTARLTRAAGTAATTVVATGEYRCGDQTLAVKRAFQVSYIKR